jgi:hypothetical protein
MNPDREASLNCPKCGAPTTMPASLTAITVTCRFCDETFALPRRLREAQERRWFQLRQGPNNPALAPGVLAFVIAMTALGIVIAGVVVYNLTQAQLRAVEVPAPPPPKTVELAPVNPIKEAIDEHLSYGEVRVKELMAEHAAEGCETVLLEPTRIVGGRDIDAKLVAKGPCVRFIASSGTTGDILDLTMQTPKKKSVRTPAAAHELDFRYCADVAGLHPATVRSLGDNPFTIASIECPRAGNADPRH